MAQALENRMVKLQLFGCDETINGLNLLFTEKEDKSFQGLIASRIVTPDMPSGGPAAVFVYHPASGSSPARFTSVTKPSCCLILEGPSGRGCYTLGVDSAEKGRGIGWTKTADKFVVGAQGGTVFLGFDSGDHFPGSGGWIVAPLQDGSMGAEKWALSWLMPGTAAIGLVKDPRPVRILIVPADEE